MSRESFRREISRAFDAMSGAPSPALSARVRSALSEQRQPRPGPIWMAGVAAALIALIVVGVLVVSNLSRHTAIVPATTPSPSPSAVATATPSASPSALPSPTSPAGAYTCNSSAQGVSNPPLIAYVNAVRTGTHAGYDQITIQFSTAQPSNVTIEPQSSATFTGAPSGRPITLAGQDGILITIRGADGHTQYTGAIDFKTNYAVLKELRQVQDFEGTVQWGLGLSHAGCYAYTFLTNPTRLVVYIQQ